MQRVGSVMCVPMYMMAPGPDTSAGGMRGGTDFRAVDAFNAAQAVSRAGMSM